MKKKTMIALCVGVIAIIIIAAIAMIAVLQESPESDYEMKISEAEKYMRSGDYDKAIIAYKAAISMDRDNEDGYLGLYRAYIRSGRTNLANQILQQGYEYTNSDEIREKLEDSPNSSETTPQSDHSGEENDVHGDVVVLNEAMLYYFASADYANYDVKYGPMQANMSGDTCIVTVKSIDATLRFYDTDSTRVIDRSKDRPYEGMLPNEIELGDIMSLFGGVSEVTYNDLRQIGAIGSLNKTSSKVTFHACGCDLTIECDSNGTFTSGAANTIVPTGTSSSEVVTYELSGQVLDADSGAALEGVSMIAYPANDTSNRSAATTAFNGAYWFMLQSSGDYVIELSKEGYISETVTVNISEDTPQSTKNFTLKVYVEPTTAAPTEPPTEATTQEPETTEPETTAPVSCEIIGTVVDATTGSGVSGVELTIYPSSSSFDKQYITTNSDGSYSVVVDAGATYIIDAYKSGYISESFEISIGEDQTLAEQHLTISPEMQTGEIRIVLTWGASPSDLDSHLTGTASDGTSIWCYFGDKVERNSNGDEVANLDVDDMSAYGPETTTIFDINGVYDFKVKDYGRTGTMASSGAEVKIYSGGSLVQTITVPAEAVNEWNVCRIDHGSIQIVNTGG
ncbi:MAG: tetratricopeptide repeat protein [Ruminococcaceae bacterium]|nr:tetratricopeptide repeat protein [Oscillospiraceae bacterium]